MLSVDSKRTHYESFDIDLNPYGPGGGGGGGESTPPGPCGTEKKLGPERVLSILSGYIHVFFLHMRGTNSQDYLIYDQHQY